MAKKEKKNKENNENNENNTPETTNDATPETEETSNVEETPKAEVKKETKKEVAQVIPDVTPSSAFLKALSANDGKYVLVSNGVQLCSYLNRPNIAVYDSYFELNGTRYNYNGIEIKHI